MAVVNSVESGYFVLDAPDGCGTSWLVGTIAALCVALSFEQCRLPPAAGHEGKDA
ncbi:MAG: hypothetical protein IKO85_00765 [Bacteroidaceae bacterium]|nr:hypothetical protein [Bacteroidaceae bacterium]